MMKNPIYCILLKVLDSNEEFYKLLREDSKSIKYGGLEELFKDINFWLQKE